MTVTFTGTPTDLLIKEGNKTIYLTHEANCEIMCRKYEIPCRTPKRNFSHFVPKSFMYPTKDGEHICNQISSLNMKVN